MLGLVFELPLHEFGLLFVCFLCYVVLADLMLVCVLVGVSLFAS